MDSISEEAFWRLVDGLMTQEHFDKSSVESLLGATLRRVYRNKFSDFYESESSSAPGLKTQKIELRLSRQSNGAGILIVDFQEPHITLAELKKRHPALAVAPPSADSADAVTYYSAHYHSRRLSIGFPRELEYATSFVVDSPNAGEEANRK